jgi:hypothetical protein
VCALLNQSVCSIKVEEKMERTALGFEEGWSDLLSAPDAADYQQQF